MDRNKLKQVCINLIQNAGEAMSRGGNLYISTRCPSNNLEIKSKPNALSDMGDVEITIRDNGPGIPDPFKSRLFEPFITSKGAGHAGLGLSIVYSTVKALEGTITCNSDHIGTSFIVVLPVAQSPKS